MRIDSKQQIAGLPSLEIRRLMRLVRTGQLTPQLAADILSTTVL